jgi:hypothetical protein
VSQTWNAHISMVNGLLDAERARRQERQFAAATTRAQQQAAFAPAPQMFTFFDEGGGGANDTATAAAPTDNGSRWGGGFPNSATIGKALDMNPMASRAGITALGLLGGPAFGMGLGAMNAFGNIANTTNNVGMLSGLGVNPGFGSTVGGLLGFNGLAGDYTDALNAAMAGRYDGFANLSPAQADGFNFGGWADIAAAMGPTAGMAPMGAVDVADMQNPGDLSGGGGWGGGGFGGLGGGMGGLFG